MDNKQRQHLLAYLGYYVMNVDGDWGSGSREACKEFQRYRGLTVDGYGGPETDKALRYAVYNGLEKPKPVEDEVVVSKEETTTGTFWDEIEFFDREEFRCQCNGRYCNGFHVEPDETLVRMCDEIRRRAGVPIAIRDAGGSGLRCPEHNASIPGAAANSYHVKGMAADLHPSGKSPSQLYLIAETVMEEMIPDKGGLGIYDWGIHVDVGPYSRWNG